MLQFWKSICGGLIVAFALVGASTSAKAASAGEINAGAGSTLDRLFRQIPGTRNVAAKAAGVLVFPTVVKAGMGVGGEYGEGAMRVGGRTVGYYNTIAASVGFQLGAQARSVVIMVHGTGDACEVPRYGWLEGRGRWIRNPDHGRRRRLDRYRQDHEPGDWVHPRFEGADV